jgi:hypothetical protein
LKSHSIRNCHCSKVSSKDVNFCDATRGNPRRVDELWVLCGLPPTNHHGRSGTGWRRVLLGALIASDRCDRDWRNALVQLQGPCMKVRQRACVPACRSAGVVTAPSLPLFSMLVSSVNVACAYIRQPHPLCLTTRATAQVVCVTDDCVACALASSPPPSSRPRPPSRVTACHAHPLLF